MNKALVFDNGVKRVFKKERLNL